MGKVLRHQRIRVRVQAFNSDQSGDMCWTWAAHLTGSKVTRQDREKTLFQRKVKKNKA